MAIKQVLVAVILHVIDLATGFIGAVKEKDLQSSKMRDGVFKKVAFIICYAVAYILDTYASELGIFTLPCKILPALVTFAVITEVISILENVHRINPELLPEKLVEIFHVGGSKDENK